MTVLDKAESETLERAAEHGSLMSSQGGEVAAEVVAWASAAAARAQAMERIHAKAQMSEQDESAGNANAIVRNRVLADRHCRRRRHIAVDGGVRLRHRIHHHKTPRRNGVESREEPSGMEAEASERSG